MVDKKYLRTVGYKRLQWMLRDDGGELSQTELGARLGTTPQAINDLLRRAKNGHLPSLSMSLLIGYVFHERCIELNTDPATADLDSDASADSPERLQRD